MRKSENFRQHVAELHFVDAGRLDQARPEMPAVHELPAQRGLQLRFGNDSPGHELLADLS
jgi:hypothetical protein